MDLVFANVQRKAKILHMIGLFVDLEKLYELYCVSQEERLLKRN